MGTIIPNLETFQKARQEIESGQISIRKASIKYGISRERLSKSELSIPKHKAADPELIKSLHEKHGGNAYAVAKELGVDHSSMAKRFVRMGLREEVTVYEQEITSQRLLITTAVSGANADKNALLACENWAKITGGQIIVIPLPYRNPTSRHENPESWFDPALVKYFLNQRVKLSKHLTLYADIHQQPTKTNPLAGKQFFGGDASGIFPHATQEFETVPVSVGKHAKWIATTGAITKPTYSDSGAGAQGRENHSMGAMIVEIDCGVFHARHIGFAKDGSFQDLDTIYRKTGSETERVDLMKLGDIHAVNADHVAINATIDQIKLLKPKHVFLEDVHDHQAGSHHSDFFRAYSLNKRGLWSVEKELHTTCKLIDKLAESVPNDCHVIITKSNHNDHLTKWLENPKNAHCLVNAEIYHRLKTAVLSGHQNPLEVFYSAHYGNPRVRFLKLGEGYLVNKIENAYHGHKGAHGARGSAAGYAKIGAKTNIGHSHSPKRKGGCMQAGTLSKPMDYTKDSPSGWMASNIVQYKDGKRTLLNIIKGKYKK